MNRIEIWAPKYSTQEVLVQLRHIEKGPNEIYFSRTKRYAPRIFSHQEFGGFRRCQVNGYAGVAIPLSLFERRQPVVENQAVLRGIG